MPILLLLQPNKRFRRNLSTIVTNNSNTYNFSDYSVPEMSYTILGRWDDLLTEGKTLQDHLQWNGPQHNFFFFLILLDPSPI